MPSESLAASVSVARDEVMLLLGHCCRWQGYQKKTTTINSKSPKHQWQKATCLLFIPIKILHILKINAFLLHTYETVFPRNITYIFLTKQQIGKMNYFIAKWAISNSLNLKKMNTSKLYVYYNPQHPLSILHPGSSTAYYYSEWCMQQYFTKKI